MSLSASLRPSLLVLAGAAAMGLAACQPAQQAANTTTASDSALAMAVEPIPPAPEAAALPAAPKPKVVYVSQPQEQYRYVDDAYAMNDAFGDAPPDYGFDYGGTRPWTWLAADNAMRVVEPISGGDRYYYYRPGSADPYLVRDNDYAYAYSGGRLVTVYDNRGRALPERDALARADYAGRYLARARALEAAARQQHREQVDAANWRARQVRIDAQRDAWAQQQRQDRQWQDYHARHEAEEHAQWAAERDRRDRETAEWQHRQQIAMDQARQQQARQDQMRLDDQRRHDEQARQDQQRRDHLHQQQAQIEQARHDQHQKDLQRAEQQRQAQARQDQQRHQQEQARLDQARRDQQRQEHQRAEQRQKQAQAVADARRQQQDRDRQPTLAEKLKATRANARDTEKAAFHPEPHGKARGHDREHRGG